MPQSDFWYSKDALALTIYREFSKDECLLCRIWCKELARLLMEKTGLVSSATTTGNDLVSLSATPAGRLSDCLLGADESNPV